VGIDGDRVVQQSLVDGELDLPGVLVVEQGQVRERALLRPAGLLQRGFVAQPQVGLAVKLQQLDTTGKGKHRRPAHAQGRVDA